MWHRNNKISHITVELMGNVVVNFTLTLDKCDLEFVVKLDHVRHQLPLESVHCRTITQ